MDGSIGFSLSLNHPSLLARSLTREGDGEVSPAGDLRELVAAGRVDGTRLSDLCVAGVCGTELTGTVVTPAVRNAVGREGTGVTVPTAHIRNRLVPEGGRGGGGKVYRGRGLDAVQGLLVYTPPHKLRLRVLRIRTRLFASLSSGFHH